MMCGPNALGALGQLPLGSWGGLDLWLSIDGARTWTTTICRVGVRRTIANNSPRAWYFGTPGGNSFCRISSLKSLRWHMDTGPAGPDVIPRGRDRRGGVLTTGRESGNEDHASTRPLKITAGRLVPCSSAACGEGGGQSKSRRNGAKKPCTTSLRSPRFTWAANRCKRTKDSGAGRCGMGGVQRTGLRSQYFSPVVKVRWRRGKSVACFMGSEVRMITRQMKLDKSHVTVNDGGDTPRVW